MISSAADLTAVSRISGAAMDQPLPKRHPNYAAIAVGALVLLTCIAVTWEHLPRGLLITADDIRVATVERGMFRNDVVVRSTAVPLHTVMLEAFESGRVEEIFVSDGALVAKGELLFRLSNPQLRLDLVAREADRAQQISNLSILRVTTETSQTEHQRRMLDINFELAQARKQLERLALLAHSGVIPAATLEESHDRLALQEQALANERQRFAVEMRIKRDGLGQMQQAIQQLDAGLQVVNEAIESLEVRAPMAGRLTDFNLQLGEIVKSEQHIGRIDDPNRFKLVADIDEYYLGSVAVGKKGVVSANGRDYEVEISRILPQIKDGRFSVDLLFTSVAPTGMSPGQSAETRITLGERSQGLILPNDAFLTDSGGAWVFVVEPGGTSADRRAIRTGRRNNSQVEVTAGLMPGERVIVSTYAAYGKAERLQLAN